MINGPTWSQKLRAEIGQAVIGQDAVIERLLVALLANGHVLLEGMPGLAKTLLIKSLGTAMGVQFPLSTESSSTISVALTPAVQIKVCVSI